MARKIKQPSRSPVLPDWFNIARYKLASTLNFQGWAVQIGNRIHLGELLDAKEFVEFDAQFTRLMSFPFTDLGFNASYPSDKTIYPLTFGVAATIAEILFDANCKNSDVCDDKLKEYDPDMFVGQAHLHVNLRASKTLIISQFNEWLDSAHIPRERGAPISNSVLDSWSESKPILPYQDLKLWHKRHDIKMPSDTSMADWLELYDGTKDTVRATARWADRAFTLDNYFDLKNSASI
jgi:hypothetical protein